MYDNVHIKNTPLASKEGRGPSGSPPSLGTFTRETNKSGVIENDIASSNSQEIDGVSTSATDAEATDGKFEIDSGGMGCTTIGKAMEERRQVLTETETKEGVVLLSVQKLKGKGSNLIETHGMCVCFLETCATLHSVTSSICSSPIPIIGPLRLS